MTISITERAQTESEVLDTAFALLVDDHRIAAAVLGGGALEVHLRRLYERTPGLTAFRGDPTIAKYDGAFAQARNTNQPVPYGTADSKSVIACNRSGGRASISRAHPGDQFPHWPDSREPHGRDLWRRCPPPATSE